MPIRNRSLAVAALLAISVGTLVCGQGLTGLLSQSGSKSSTASVAAADPLRRDTPRSSIYAFLEACHVGNFLRASEYLDLSKIAASERAVEGPELARELGELLDRNPNFEVARLSNNPEGDLADGLNPNRDTLATFELNEEPVTLQLQRETQRGVSIWLVSTDSIARIPELRALAGESPIEKKLPAPLVRVKFVGTPIWIWIALVLIALILSAVSKWLSRLLLAAITPVAKRYATSLQNYRLQTFIEPLRLLLAVIVFRACMEAIPPSALLRDYLLKLIAFLFIAGGASLAMRIVDVIFDQVLTRLDSRQRAISYSVISLSSRFIKICVFCLAALWVLTAWGYNTTTILAGLGVGGLAVALAAQKTIENLFGGISVIFDRPVLVGDYCQFGGQAGTVEDIGLRSTRIRTNDRTVVTIPNSQFSTMNLENFSRRDRMWFHPTLSLRRETSPEDIQAMMDAVTTILREHPMVDASGVPVRFTKITPLSFDLEIFSYVLTADGNQYLKVQTELLLKILEAAAKLNVRFAVPFAESMSVPTDQAKSMKESAAVDTLV